MIWRRRRRRRRRRKTKHGWDGMGWPLLFYTLTLVATKDVLW
jgi:hypothetical protein